MIRKLLKLFIRKLLKLFRVHRSVYLSNFIVYLKNIIRGKKWTQFYEDLMDESVKNDKDIFGKPEDMQHHLEYMKTKGLQPESRFLDYGCGSGVSGKSFIEYLNENNYTGVDISNEAIKVACEMVNDNTALKEKNPDFKYIMNADMESLKGYEFDYIFANSVFTHMPLKDINYMLKQLKTCIHKGSIYYSTICPTEGKSKMVKFRDWRHSVDAVKKVAEENGYECKVHSDWDQKIKSLNRDSDWVHKIKSLNQEGRDTMLSFQLRA